MNCPIEYAILINRQGSVVDRFGTPDRSDPLGLASEIDIKDPKLKGFSIIETDSHCLILKTGKMDRSNIHSLKNALGVAVLSADVLRGSELSERSSQLLENLTERLVESTQLAKLL